MARPALRMCSTRLVDVPCSGGHFSGSATRDLRGHADLSAGPDRCTSRGTCEPFDFGGEPTFSDIRNRTDAGARDS